MSSSFRQSVRLQYGVTVCIVSFPIVFSWIKLRSALYGFSSRPQRAHGEFLGRRGQSEAGLASGASLNTTVQFGSALPPELIVGGDEGSGGTFRGKSLSWPDAVSYCTSQGGHLPANAPMPVAGFPSGSHCWSRNGNGTNEIC